MATYETFSRRLGSFRFYVLESYCIFSKEWYTFCYFQIPKGNKNKGLPHIGYYKEELK